MEKHLKMQKNSHNFESLQSWTFSMVAILFALLLMLLFVVHSCNETIDTSEVEEETSSIFSSPQIMKNRNSWLGEDCKGPFLSVLQDGRLGNLMVNYAMIYAFAKEYPMRPVLEHEMAAKLGHIFPHLSIGPMPNCTFEWNKVPAKDMENPSQVDKARNTYISTYWGNFTWFDKYRSELAANDFRMRPDLENAAQRYLRRISESTGATRLVGIHVRLTDYRQHLRFTRGRTLTGLYYMTAMQMFRNHYRDHKVAFLVASDDKAWCKRVLGKEEGFHLTDASNSPELDMLILSKTNGSIIGFGSFGFWSVYLRPYGDVIAASGYSSKEHPILSKVRELMPFAKVLADPCFEPSTDINKPPQLTPHCEARKEEYGIRDPFIKG